MLAVKNGVARGIFSNEAGLGSAPIAAAAAKTQEPARQGLVTMTGTFIDTIIVCTMTGLAIVISGCTETNPELQGVEITNAAFQYGLPFPHKVTSFILMICLVFLRSQLFSAGITTPSAVFHISQAQTKRQQRYIV